MSGDTPPGTAPRPSHSVEPLGHVAPDRYEIAPDQEPWWRHLTWPVVIAVLAGGGMLLAGVPLWRTIVLALGIGAAWWAVVATVNVEAGRWPDDVPGAPYRTGAVWDVPGLAAARQSADAFSEHLRPRLWAIASELLRRRGIDSESTEARACVGPRDYDLLTGADEDPARRTAAAPALAAALARLAVSPELPGPVPMPQPELVGLAHGTRTSARAASRHTRGAASPNAASPAATHQLADPHDRQERL